ncbi:hypothetical protein J7E83_16550 [Arthrobacter sp. ISL-48]|uniref:hypothetical protein n=1 Tax=Arthrobacter sp. ISL-48 TaxID=2819110 RepID=UPI001BEA8A1F|nr:hypothetical protein [Arthrobacter sp. ISL-48]MBT2533705.1 hypothetical protein [Arthrobacter sp. ISL-48]
MGDSTTIALNLTFFGTLGLALMMFFGLFLLVVATLVLAGLGRLVALTVMALFGRVPKSETVAVVHLPLPDGSGVVPPAEPPVSTARPAARRSPRDWGTLLKPSQLRSRLRTAVVHHPLLTAARREPPVLAKDWATAVAEADARAMARARASVPDIKHPAADPPGPGVPAETVVAVAPLVESALHKDHPLRDVPRTFKKPSATAPLSLLDTGSLVSMSAHDKALKPKLQADRH